MLYNGNANQIFSYTLHAHSENMLSLVYAILISSAASSIIGSSNTISSTNVTFQQDQTSPRCSEKVVVLTTSVDANGKTRHEFRLECTSAMYVTPSSDAIGEWSAILPLTVQFHNVSGFFKNQDTFITKYPLDALQPKSAEIVIYFDTSNGNFNFSLVVNDTLLLLYRETNEKDFRYVSKIGNAFNTTVNPYINGTNMNYLKACRPYLESERNIIYKYVRERDDNSTNSYDLYVRNGTIICVIESEAPWYYQFYIDGCRTQSTETNYDDVGATYSTVAKAPRGHKNVSTCRIEFPNGMSVTQTISLPRLDLELETATTMPPNRMCEIQNIRVFDITTSDSPKNTSYDELPFYVSEYDTESYTSTVPLSSSMINATQTAQLIERGTESDLSIGALSRTMTVEQTSVIEYHTKTETPATTTPLVMTTIAQTNMARASATHTPVAQTITLSDRVTGAMTSTVVVSSVSAVNVQMITAQTIDVSDVNKTRVSDVVTSSVPMTIEQTTNYDGDPEISVTTSSYTKMTAVQTIYTADSKLASIASTPLTIDYEEDTNVAKSFAFGTGLTVAIVTVIIVIILIVSAFMIYRRQTRLTKRKCRDIL